MDKKVVLFSCNNIRSKLIAESIIKKTCDNIQFLYLDEDTVNLYLNDIDVVYLCKDDEFENISDCRQLINKGVLCDFVVFVKSENLDEFDKKDAHIRFVNEIRYTVLKRVFENDIYKLADENNCIKICVNSLSEANLELIKVLSWFHFRKGYKLYISVNTNVDEWNDFKNRYPGLCNHNTINYSDRVTYTIGKDENNYNNYAVIQIDENDICSVYDENILINPTVERIAMNIFTLWSEGKVDFWKKESDYRTSVASALFWLKRKSDGENCEVSDENMRLEHLRWNTFMIADGYTYGDVRDDLNKKHPCLVSYEELTLNDKLLDANPIKSIQYEFSADL